MKKLFILLVLTSCSSIDLDAKMPDSNGMNGTCHVTYKKLGKSEISGINANICGGSLGVDKSSTDTPSGVNSDALLCLLIPQACAKPEVQE